MFKIQTLNKISTQGLAEFPRDDYEVASEILNPDAILLRSADMHSMEIPGSVKAVARAGAGTNNIPIPAMTEKGIVVFNTPGANANAVRELAILSLLMASRPVVQANAWVKTLAGKGSEIADLAEKGKSQFVGPEIRGKTLGVIGLGAIGAMVANSASDLGMKVIGYDPFISIEAAWSLSRSVRKAETLDTILTQSDYITIHVPQTPETKGLINAERIKAMKNGVRIINLARGGLVVNADIIAGINSGKIACFVTDFTDEDLLNNDKIVCLPHLGASTPEAEENCALMAVRQLKNFLETGAIVNSVNFPKCKIEDPIPVNGTRLCISHKNIPNMVGQITTVLAGASLNIAGMVNQNRGDLAYNIIDLDTNVSDEIIDKLQSIEGVIKVRPIHG
ncbi:MAG: phosphoglycerate dehydrogenase [Candidatus Treponema excrementipullorum]|nr:phosphoglycerate dehydrogenase [Spirochaetia bacterium]MDY2755075.1 phosphoglycerate dehydrogenase [Candidatus Treponema excrementipullorum]MCI6952335.1 phosphoglycerate dehydrogenase [Spirochaetia bacterium]MCI7589536.1 phosphoglycerate dehydrogenase [Spirochaetia bacterium]MDY4466300.1 phosphoglycerate dehydrogenase [Candidatus Treponema excrementipullorum]